MKGLAFLGFVLLLGMSAFNWYEIRNLRQEVARLNLKVDEASSGGLADQAVQRALETIMQARVAVQNTDWVKAKSMLESAREQIGSAASKAGEKAGPALRWIEDQARALGEKVKEKAP